MQINDIFTYWEKTSVNNVIIFPLIGHLKKENFTERANLLLQIESKNERLNGVTRKRHRHLIWMRMLDLPFNFHDIQFELAGLDVTRAIKLMKKKTQDKICK